MMEEISHQRDPDHNSGWEQSGPLPVDPEMPAIEVPKATAAFVDRMASGNQQRTRGRRRSPPRATDPG